MTNDIVYTHLFADFDSSVVDSVWYDEVTQTAYVDLEDRVYKYDSVPFAEVEALVQAPSVGRAFSGNLFNKGFKQKFGPSTFIGNYWEVDEKKREEVATSPTVTIDGPVVAYNTNSSSNPGGGKNLTYAANAVVDGEVTNTANSPEVRVSLGGSKDTQPVRVPLKVPANEPVEPADEYEFTVHFESNGSKTYTVKAVSWQSAIEKLNEAADILGVRVKVTGVFVHLG